VIAFVAGATGYVGREVVRALRERGVDTVAHVRPDSSRLDDWRQRFEALGAAVDTTAWEPDAMAATMARLEPSVVFALLGTTRKRARRSGDPNEGYETVDYGLTRLLVDAAAGTGARFVYLSSAGVSDRSRSAYLSARAKAEQAVRASGLPFVIARPSFITGPDRDDGRPGERVGAAVADGALAIAGIFGARKLRARYRSTSNLTLADALVRLALDPDAANSVVESEGLRG
jgi:uncharacterized protein YbjT (DUF2867 family)